MSEPSGQTKAGFVALIGAPNAGKSTLMNALVGQKISIVTHKVQTTRTRVLGILNHGDTQMVFVDTPGLFAPKRRLDRAMVNSAWSGASEADVIVLLVDVTRSLDSDAYQGIIERLSNMPDDKKILLCLNKIDDIEKEKLLPLAERLFDKDVFDKAMMISALKNKGLDDLKEALAEAIPQSPWLYPADQVSDMPIRLLAAEITREKLFERLHQELPYALTVETEKWEEEENGRVIISQTIYVTRPGHKGIVLGKGGQTIKAVGTQARKEIMALVDGKVHLELFVKVREKWMDDPARYQPWGLDFNA